MPLATCCDQSFDRQVKARGRSYFQQRRVLLTNPGPLGVTAHVVGSQRYNVTLDWSQCDDGVLTAWCSCPYFEGGLPCKHIWAAILAVDCCKLADPYVGNRRLAVVCEDDLIDEFVDEDEDVGEDDEESADYGRPGREFSMITRPPARQAGRQQPRGQWRQVLDQLRPRGIYQAPRSHHPSSLLDAQRDIWYVLDVGASLEKGHLRIGLFQRERKGDGQFGNVKPLRVTDDEIDRVASGEQRSLLKLALACNMEGDYHGSHNEPSFNRYGDTYSDVQVAPVMYEILLPRLAASDRFVWVLDKSEIADGQGRAIRWDDGPPWRFRLRILANDDKQQWEISGQVVRDEEAVPLRDVVLLLAHGAVLFPDRMARLDAADDFAWICLLRRVNTVDVPYEDEGELQQFLCGLTSAPDFELPENLRWENVRVSPHGRLRVLPKLECPATKLYARVSFLYDEHDVPLDASQTGIVDAENKRIIIRDKIRESELLASLSALGIQRPGSYYSYNWDVEFPRRSLAEIVDHLVRAEWVVEAEGGRIRRPGSYSLSVKSGVDWFELEGAFDFDGFTASLPELLKAVRNGERYVRLDDGSQGILPQDWLARYGALAELGDAEGETLKFVPSQAALLDALIAAQEPNVQVDATFEKVRQKLRSFDGVESRRQPRMFAGQLRQYQQEGLGWLHFLKEFRLGGCLADDMGLGKTVQVLALLESRRTRRMPRGQARTPSLIVVPRSLVFNWIEEAERFTPKLKVLNYTGLDRAERIDQFGQYDAIVTTYGTLRRDVVKLQDTRFDYAILDESQAIKNAQSQAAKACRLINAEHRLAMTGTPVENHLGELWSLFEFLNPGMLGRSSAFKGISKNGRPTTTVSIRGDDHATLAANTGGNGVGVGSAKPENQALAVLAQAMRPFILRRTKDKVLTELPEKTEQTLFCEMQPKQRKLYDQLRDYYRASLGKRVRESGIMKSKIHVLEALLRLRQAACHPGLLDPAKQKDSSAKLETLLEQVTEVIEEGHKSLVFSQFTSLLAIVRQHLDKRGIVYEYLDGQTRDRRERVHRFQNDATCPLFLISLKAGGQGLNLTAAEYVFILDPWWNPAVEAQAVDRAHRIGQTRRVFAYRLICRDTVEEKILQLQQTKRDLADAIISADNSLIRNLTTEDLQLLLS